MRTLAPRECFLLPLPLFQASSTFPHSSRPDDCSQASHLPPSANEMRATPHYRQCGCGGVGSFLRGFGRVKKRRRLPRGKGRARRDGRWCVGGCTDGWCGWVGWGKPGLHFEILRVSWVWVGVLVGFWFLQRCGLCVVTGLHIILMVNVSID